MDLGKIVTALMGCLLLAFCLVTAVLYLLPLYQKIQMDQLCRDYLYAVNANEGMNLMARTALVDELEAEGLTDVYVTAPNPGALRRRERQAFQVSGKLELSEASGFLQFRSKTVVYEFKGWVYGKRIIN